MFGPSKVQNDFLTNYSILHLILQILLEFDPPKNQSDIWLDINRPQCNTVINPLDLNSAKILIDLINKEAECIVRSVWTDSRKSDTNEWVSFSFNHVQ